MPGMVGGFSRLGAFRFLILRRHGGTIANQKKHKNHMIDRILPGYGAIDIGQEKIFVACSGAEEVRSFSTFSADLEVAAEYLVQRGIG